MKKYARQGDVTVDRGSFGAAFDGRRVESHSVAGSGNTRHVILGESLVRVDGEVTRARVLVDTELFHDPRHSSTPLPAGDYVFAPIRERGDGVDRTVED